MHPTEIKKAIAEGLSEATKNSAAAEPYAYLVLFFAAFVVVAILWFLFRILAATAKTEAERMQTLQEMQRTCHVQAMNSMETSTKAAERCESALHSNTRVMERVVQRLEASG